MTRDLEGRLVVVTGSGRGLGLAVARELCSAGAAVVLAERDPELAANAFRELDALGARVHRVDTDVADPDSVARLAERTAELGGASAVVNNAALADGVGGKPFYDVDPHEFDRVLSVNLRGAWLVSRALYPQLRACSGGRILNLASDVAFYGPPRLVHYVASKGGIVAMTRAMARDAGPDGITVNAVAPGITECEATDNVPAERHELYRSNRALSRSQHPEDLVGSARFLLSEAADYVTGQTLLVNGGFVCR